MSNREISELYDSIRNNKKTERKQNISDLYRCMLYESTGNDNPFKSLCKKLNTAGTDGHLSDQDILYLNQFLDSRAYVPSIVEHLNNSNITSTTLTDKNAVDGIINILQVAGVTDKFAQYLSKPMSFKSLGSSGNVIDILSKHLSKYGIPADVIISLMRFEGSESGRGVGRCEIGLATVFGDVAMRDGAGDLSYNGKYLEVKGRGARLGGRDVPMAGFDQSILGTLAVANNIEGAATKGGIKYNIIDLITTLSQMGVNKKELQNGLLEFVQKNYEHASMPSMPQLNNSDGLRQFLEICYFTHYSNKEEIEYFIFINTKVSAKKGATEKTPIANFGQYLIFQSKDIPKLINARAISAGVITSLNVYPSTGAPKIGNVPSEAEAEA